MKNIQVGPRFTTQTSRFRSPLESMSSLRRFCGATTTWGGLRNRARGARGVRKESSTAAAQKFVPPRPARVVVAPSSNHFRAI